MIATDRLLQVFVDVADTLVEGYDLIDFLHDLTDHAVAVTGATAAGIVLGDDRDQLQFMAASNEDARSVELMQLQAEEGPCLQCYLTSEPVTVVDLREATSRWPTFATLALERGVMAAHAFPMRLRGLTIGAINLFDEGPRAFKAEESRATQALADIATIGILQERAISEANVLTSQLQFALNSRIVVEQAKGVVAQTLGIDVDTAFGLLRRYSRREQRALLDVSEDVVAGRLSSWQWQE